MYRVQILRILKIIKANRNVKKKIKILKAYLFTCLTS